MATINLFTGLHSLVNDLQFLGLNALYFGHCCDSCLRNLSTLSAITSCGDPVWAFEHLLLSVLLPVTWHFRVRTDLRLTGYAREYSPPWGDSAFYLCVDGSL
jgi:hypothetical protein